MLAEEIDKETHGLPARRSRRTCRVEIQLAVEGQAQSSPRSSTRVGCGAQAHLEVRLPGLQRAAKQEVAQEQLMLGYGHLSSSHPGAGYRRLSNGPKRCPCPS